MREEMYGKCEMNKPSSQYNIPEDQSMFYLCKNRYP